MRAASATTPGSEGRQHEGHYGHRRYMDAEIIGSYFEEMLKTSRRLVWPLWSVSPRHLGKFLAQNKIRLFPHWRNACPGQVSRAAMAAGCGRDRPPAVASRGSIPQTRPPAQGSARAAADSDSAQKTGVNRAPGQKDDSDDARHERTL